MDRLRRESTDLSTPPERLAELRTQFRRWALYDDEHNVLLNPSLSTTMLIAEMAKGNPYAWANTSALLVAFSNTDEVAGGVYRLVGENNLYTMGPLIESIRSVAETFLRSQWTQGNDPEPMLRILAEASRKARYQDYRAFLLLRRALIVASRMSMTWLDDEDRQRAERLLDAVEIADKIDDSAMVIISLSDPLRKRLAAVKKRGGMIHEEMWNLEERNEENTEAFRSLRDQKIRVSMSRDALDAIITVVDVLTIGATVDAIVDSFVDLIDRESHVEEDLRGTSLDDRRERTDAKRMEARQAMSDAIRSVVSDDDVVEAFLS